jgi:hypothetical protein
MQFSLVVSLSGEPKQHKSQNDGDAYSEAVHVSPPTLFRSLGTFIIFMR